MIDAIEGYRLDLAAQAIYDFTWNEYCDWYLELSKPVLQSENSSEDALRGTRHTLVSMLEGILRLAHPIIPYITEEIWQRVAPLAGKTGETVMLQAYPEVNHSAIDSTAIRETELVMQLNQGIRRIRGEMNISPGKLLVVTVQGLSHDEQQILENTAHCSMFISRLESLDFVDAAAELPESATALVGSEGRLNIPMAGLIDKDAELSRLKKEIDKKRKDSEKREAKLANENYVNKAPADVVNKERDKVAELRSEIARLEEQLQRIEAI